MSVAQDGSDVQQPGETPRGARHRVPPTAAGSAGVPALPEPFSPAKPTFPAGAAIPRQRRNGPTAVATAAIPALPLTALDALDADLLTPELPEPTGPLFDTPEGRPEDEAADRPADRPADVEDTDPATVSTFAGAMRADAATEAPAAMTAVFEPVAPMLSADDSPTVADYVPPAVTIVSDEPVEDAADYRGSRRKLAAWRRYPLGALAVAVLILLVTTAVVLQLRSGDDRTTPTGAGMPQTVPGVNGLPEPARPGAGSPSPSNTSPSASPSATKSKLAVPVVPPVASGSVSPSVSRSPSAPAPPPVTTGQFKGAVGSTTFCMEYRAGDNNRVVIDGCDRVYDPRHGNQRWSVQGDGSIRSDGGCLDVQNAGTGNGNTIQVYDCNGTPAQKWTARGDGTWVNPHSGRCLDVANGATGSGTAVILWDCTGAANQRWSLQAF